MAKVKVISTESASYNGENFTPGESREIEVDNVEALPYWLTVVKAKKVAAKKSKKATDEASKG